MMYQFIIDGLEASSYSFATVTLRSVPNDERLHVRLTPSDSQALASELAGVPTVRSRLAITVCRLVQQLDATLEGVYLHCGTGNVVEAELMVACGFERLGVPVGFGDGIALAVANRLSIYGDESLTPLLQPGHEEAEPQTPTVFAAFLDSLSDAENA